MFIAITDGSIDLIKRMLDVGASLRDLSYFNDNALHAVCYSQVDNGNKCEYLICCDKTLIDSVNLRGDLPLHTAALRGRSDIIDALLNHGADLNAQGHDDRTPLHMTTIGHHTRCVSRLLERGANILALERCDETAFSLARSMGYKGTSRFIFFVQFTRLGNVTKYLNL